MTYLFYIAHIIAAGRQGISNHDILLLWNPDLDAKASDMDGS